MPSFRPSFGRWEARVGVKEGRKHRYYYLGYYSTYESARIVEIDYKLMQLQEERESLEKQVKV